VATELRIKGKSKIQYVDKLFLLKKLKILSSYALFLRILRVLCGLANLKKIPAQKPSAMKNHELTADLKWDPPKRYDQVKGTWSLVEKEPKMVVLSGSFSTTNALVGSERPTSFCWQDKRFLQNQKIDEIEWPIIWGLFIWALLKTDLAREAKVIIQEHFRVSLNIISNLL